MQGEVNMLLDLVSSLEAQQHMGMANIPPQSSTLQQLTRQRDLHLQAKACQLKVSCAASPCLNLPNPDIPPC